MGWSRPPLSRPPRRPGRRAVRRPAGVRTGWAEARTGPYWPYARGRKEKRTAERRRQGKEDEREEAAGKLAASDRGWGRGAAGKASAGLKVEGANVVQRVESLAERINRLAGKETRKALQNYTICVARNID